MHIVFQHPWLLYFLGGFPLIVLMWLHTMRNTRPRQRIVTSAMQPKLMPVTKAGRRWTQLFLVVLASILLCVAAAGPRWGEKETRVFQKSRDLVLAIDVSRSMLASDVYPSRLQRAIVDTMDLIDKLDGDRAALIAFRASPSLICPLTTDYRFLKQTLADIGLHSAPPGETDIGAAIARALQVFDEDEGSHRAIVLISDGEDLSGTALDMADEAGAKGIPIYTVGLGSKAGAAVPGQDNFPMQYEGSPVLSKLAHETLFEMARRSGGSYVPIAASGVRTTTLGTIYREHLRQLAQREQVEVSKIQRVERFQWFAAFALICLMAAAFLSIGRIGHRAAKVAATLLILCFVLPYATLAQTATNTATASPVTSPHEIARDAQRAFKQSHFATAAALYREAAEGSAANEARLYAFNQAVSDYAQGYFAQAAETFRQLALQPHKESDRAWAPLGLSLYHAGLQVDTTSASGLVQRVELWEQAAEALKEALRLTPDDTSIQHDLSLLKNQLPPARQVALQAELMEQYANAPINQLTDQMLDAQRRISGIIAQVADQPLPEQIRILEQMAAAQTRNRNRLIPLLAKLESAIQGQSQLTPEDLQRLASLIEVTRRNMDDAISGLEDIRPEAYRPARMAQQGVYQLWKQTADYHQLLREGMRQQTNAILQVDGKMRSDPALTTLELQRETAELTDRFAAQIQQQPTANEDQNAPQPANNSMSPETQAQILALAERASQTQRESADLLLSRQFDQAMQQQHAAYTLLETIRDLLPEQENSQSPENQQPSASPQSDNQNEPDPDENQPDQEQEQPQSEDQSTEQPEEPQQDQPQPQDNPPPPNEPIERTLQRALEREQEHRERQRERLNRIPLPPSERDW